MKSKVVAAVGCRKIVCLDLGPGSRYSLYSADVQKYCIKHQIHQKVHALDIAKADVEKNA